MISIPSYGLILVELQETNIKTIGPMDKAIFPIEVTNEFTIDMTVTFKIEHIPKNWKAIIHEEILVPAGSTSVVYLIVVPPNGFGFHDDMTTIKAIVNENRTSSQNLTVIVESVGFSLFGIEIILPLILFIFSIVIIANLLYKKKFHRYFWQKR